MSSKIFVIPELPYDYYELVADLERKLLMEALDRAKGSRVEAGKLVGLARTTFIMRCKAVGLELPTPKQTGWLYKYAKAKLKTPE